MINSLNSTQAGPQFGWIATHQKSSSEIREQVRREIGESDFNRAFQHVRLVADGARAELGQTVAAATLVHTYLNTLA